MKIALVNTNRFLRPPTIPIGLEHLLVPLERAGHEPVVCDLTFSESPVETLARFLEAEKPGAVGFSVRNLDTALFTGIESFLEGAAELVRAARECTGAPLLAGGASTLCARDSLRERLGVDHLVRGPGELALPQALDSLTAGVRPPEVIDGWAAGVPTDIVHARARDIEYEKYLEGGNPAGLEFRKGCTWACAYCVERCSPIFQRDVGAVIEEARLLAEAGVTMLFLSECEVNVDVEGTEAFLDALAAEELPLHWSGYFKPRPFSETTARLMDESGCSSVTLSVASADLYAEPSPYDERDVTRFISTCAEEGLEVAVDLLVGMPGEGRPSVERALDLLEDSGAERVTVASHLRLYETLPLADTALKTPDLLLGAVDSNPSFLQPVFYCAVDGQWLEERVRGSAVLSIAGEDQLVNYQVVGMEGAGGD